MKKYKTLTMDEKFHEQLKFLAKITGNSQIGLLRQLISQLISIGAVFKENTILQFETSSLCGSVTVTFIGSSRMSVGNMTSQGESDEVVDERVEQTLVKLEGDLKK